jgi:hypothetical protein
MPDLSTKPCHCGGTKRELIALVTIDEPIWANGVYKYGEVRKIRKGWLCERPECLDWWPAILRERIVE